MPFMSAWDPHLAGRTTICPPGARSRSGGRSEVACGSTPTGRSGARRFSSALPHQGRNRSRGARASSIRPSHNSSEKGAARHATPSWRVARQSECCIRAVDRRTLAPKQCTLRSYLPGRLRRKLDNLACYRVSRRDGLGSFVQRYLPPRRVSGRALLRTKSKDFVTAGHRSTTDKTKLAQYRLALRSSRADSS